MKHTKGPWKHIPNTTSITAERPFICGDVRPPIPIATVCCNDLASEQANARLIASAPDLLAALRGMVFHSPSKDKITAGHSEWFDRARAAIARATGE